MKKVLKNKLLNGSNAISDNNRKSEDAHLFSAKTVMSLTFGVLLLLFLYVVSRYNYLLFHTTAELFSITIAWSLFVVVWNSRHLSDNRAFVLSLIHI